MRGPFFIAHRSPTFSWDSSWFQLGIYLQRDSKNLMSWGCTKRHLLVAAFIEQGIQHPKLHCVWGWCWSSDILPRKYGLGLGKIHPHKCFEKLESRRECFALNNQKWDSHPSGGIWLRWLIEIHCICIYFHTFPRHLLFMCCFFQVVPTIDVSQILVLRWAVFVLGKGRSLPRICRADIPGKPSLSLYTYIYIFVW